MGDVEKVLSGEGTPELGRDLLFQMAAYYPISLRDLWVETDDTEDGIAIMTAAESKATARIFDRSNRSGTMSPYYEYRDTAMSKFAPYRPEWIKELRKVNDCNPSNPDIAFNNGHILHQLTFFVGEVNFYWKVNGKTHSQEMNTGDSALITPFVPHSFATRSLDPKRQGLIIAVTYRGNVNRAADDMSRLDLADLATITGSLRDPLDTLNARVHRYCQIESLSRTDLTRRLELLGMGKSKAKTLATLSQLPNSEEISVLSNALNVKNSDLLVTPINPDEEVVVTTKAKGFNREFPDSVAPFCTLSELARSRHQPNQRSFDVHMTGDDKHQSTPGFKHHLHEYLFNYGSHPIQLMVGQEKQKEIEPGGSAYISPSIEHWLQGPYGAKLLMVRVAGGLTDEALNEFSGFAENGKERAIMENKQWF